MQPHPDIASLVFPLHAAHREGCWNAKRQSFAYRHYAGRVWKGESEFSAKYEDANWRVDLFKNRDSNGTEKKR